LQPQDRRSKNPGDSRAAAEARRRLLDAGCGTALLAALKTEVAARRLGTAVPAVELAARRYPGVTWVVANADRFLPYGDGSFDLVLSLDARLSAGEMRRVLAPEGRLLVAVPAPDDLVELRAAVLGEGVLRDRLARAAELLAPDFVLEDRRT